jgi:hypothetical protein
LARRQAGIARSRRSARPGGACEGEDLVEVVVEQDAAVLSCASRGREALDVVVDAAGIERRELVVRAARRNESGEWAAAPITRAHFETWARAFEPPDEDELRLYDDPLPIDG